MPRVLKGTGVRKPWYGTLRELRSQLYQLARQGCTLGECAAHFGVARTTLVDLLSDKEPLAKAYRQGRASLKQRTRSMVALLALGPEGESTEDDWHVEVKDQIRALQMLVRMQGLDQPEPDVLGDTESVEANSLAEIMLHAESIELAIDSGEITIDPVHGSRKSKKRRSKRKSDYVRD